MREVLEDGDLALDVGDVLSDHLLAQNLLAGYLLEGLSECQINVSSPPSSPSSVGLTLTFNAR